MPACAALAVDQRFMLVSNRLFSYLSEGENLSDAGHQNAMEKRVMLRKIALLAAALTIMTPAFADTPSTDKITKPVLTPLLPPAVPPKQVIKKPPPPCKPTPGHTACPRQ